MLFCLVYLLAVLLSDAVNLECMLYSQKQPLSKLQRNGKGVMWLQITTQIISHFKYVFLALSLFYCIYVHMPRVVLFSVIYGKVTVFCPELGCTWPYLSQPCMMKLMVHSGASTRFRLCFDLGICPFYTFTDVECICFPPCFEEFVFACVVIHESVSMKSSGQVILEVCCGLRRSFCPSHTCNWNLHKVKEISNREI